MKGQFILYDGNYLPANQAVFASGIYGIMYGMGLFETILWNGKEMVNATLHLERLLRGANLLQLELPKNFSTAIMQKGEGLLKKNGHQTLARVRLMLVSSEKGWPPEKSSAHYLMESGALEPFPARPLIHTLGIYTGGKKSVDIFSTLKNNNYLHNVMASKFAVSKGWQDAVMLNSFGRVCETIHGNIFMVKNGSIFTPPLSEGCVAGTTRQWLLNEKNNLALALFEKEIPVEDMMNADEIFSTNSIKLVISHALFENRTYGNAKAPQLYEVLKENFKVKS